MPPQNQIKISKVLKKKIICVGKKKHLKNIFLELKLGIYQIILFENWELYALFKVRIVRLLVPLRIN